MFIIAYDISDSKERAKVVKCVEQCCRRVQKSVWMGELSSHALGRLRRKLEELNLQTGMVDIWEGRGTPQRIGGSEPFPELEACHVV